MPLKRHGLMIPSRFLPSRRDALLTAGLLLCLLAWSFTQYGLVHTAMALGRSQDSGILGGRLLLILAVSVIAMAGCIGLSSQWFSRHLRLYQQIFERSNDAIAVIGEDGRYTLQNQSHRDFLGFDDETFLGTLPAYRAGDTDLKTVETLRGIRQFSGEYRVRHASGELIDVGLSCFTISNELGEALYYIEFKRDIREHRKLAARIREERERFEALSRTDFLTGLCNRHALIEQIEREISRARRYGHPVAMLMFDIDHFKRINDTFGHNMGDTVICRVACLARSRLRESDFIGRWGGEEFLILLPETAEEAAAHLAEMLRSSIADPALHPDSEPHATCSFGVAVHRPGEELVAWIGRTDAALYAAKHHGRNRVEISRCNEENP